MLSWHARKSCRDFKDGVNYQNRSVVTVKIKDRIVDYKRPSIIGLLHADPYIYAIAASKTIEYQKTLPSLSKILVSTLINPKISITSRNGAPGTPQNLKNPHSQLNISYSPQSSISSTRRPRPRPRPRSSIPPRNQGANTFTSFPRMTIEHVTHNTDIFECSLV